MRYINRLLLTYLLTKRGCDGRTMAIQRCMHLSKVIRARIRRHIDAVRATNGLVTV